MQEKDKLLVAAGLIAMIQSILITDPIMAFVAVLCSPLIVILISLLPTKIRRIDPPTIDAAREAKKRVAAILDEQGVEASIGIAKAGEGFAVKVNLKDPSDADLPSVVDGVSVRLESVGRMRKRQENLWASSGAEGASLLGGAVILVAMFFGWGPVVVIMTGLLAFVGRMSWRHRALLKSADLQDRAALLYAGMQLRVRRRAAAIPSRLSEMWIHDHAFFNTDFTEEAEPIKS